MKRVALAVLFSILLLHVYLFSREEGSSKSPLREVAEKTDGTRGGQPEKAFLVIVGGGEEKNSLLTPEFIDVDREGNIYIVDSHNGKLEKVNAGGDVVWRVDGSEWGGDGFLHPGSISVADGFDLYLLDIGRRKIFRLNERGEVLGVVSGEGLSDPKAIALTESGKLVVYDGLAAEISVFSTSGDLLWSFKPVGFRARNRVGLVVRNEEELCLWTRGSGRIRIYHFMGGVKRTFEPMMPDGTALKVSSVDFDAAGRMLVLDSGMPGLFAYDRLGNLLLDMSEPLRDSGFAGPGEIRSRGRSLYVADVRGGKVLEMRAPPLLDGSSLRGQR